MSEITIDYIQKIVADYFNLPLDALQRKTRKREILQARQIAMYFSKSLTGSSLASIGAQIGGKDHATVLHACKIVNNLIDTDKQFRADVEEIEKRLVIKENDKPHIISLKDIFFFGFGLIIKESFSGDRITGKSYSVGTCCSVALRIGYSLKSISEYLNIDVVSIRNQVNQIDISKIDEMSEELNKIIPIIDDSTQDQ